MAFNLAASVAPGAGRWTCHAYVRNAGNTTAMKNMLVTSSILGFARQVTYTAPRLFGLGVTLDF